MTTGISLGAALENDWNGALLTTIDEALRWVANMPWNGVSPFVHRVEGIYTQLDIGSQSQVEGG